MERKKIHKTHRRARRWLPVLLCLAVVLLFGTVSALTLPASTMQPQCGFAEHTHIDACYTQVEDGAQETLICTEAHEHNARCYGTWVVACGKAEHTHTEACFPEAAAFSAEQETATAPNIYKPLYNDWKIVKFVNSNRISAFSNDGTEAVVTPLEENGNPYLDDRTMWILPSSSTERPRRAAVRTAIATPPR